MNKVKLVMVTNHFGITGIGTVMMNYCKALDKNKYDITILTGQPIADIYEKECEDYGIHLIALPSRHGEPRDHYISLWKALKAGHYDIVHIHGSSTMMALELSIAKLAGVKIRIVHSHNKPLFNKLIYRILKPVFKHNYTKGLACSELAGEWLFGKNNYEVLVNGFNTMSFEFDEEKRLKIRKRLHIEDCYVIGHVGRFNEQKNQFFLLEIFNEIIVKKPNAVLLLVGTGSNFKNIKELVSIHPYKNQIILYGETEDVASLYSAMDVFVFPSKYEGLGLVAVEAQISGLPCIVSDVIPKDIVISENVYFISLKDTVDRWTDAVVHNFITEEYRKGFFINHKPIISHYDIQRCVNSLENLYQQALRAL